MNSVIAIPPSIASVVAALRDFGLRNAGTPLLMASHTGQRRAPGRERPRHQEHQRQTRDVTVLGMQIEPGRLGLQRAPQHVDLDEAPGQHHQHAGHERVGGMAKADPDSRMPRRLTAVSSGIAVTAKATLWWATNGRADPYSTSPMPSTPPRSARSRRAGGAGHRQPAVGPRLVVTTS